MPGGADAVMAVQRGTSAESLSVVKDGGSLEQIAAGEIHLELEHV